MSSSFTGNPNNPLPENYIIPDDSEQKDLKLREYLNSIAVATNTKTSGLYDSEVTITGDRFLATFSTTTSSNINYRTVFRKTIDFGALPATGSKNVAHGISTQSTYSLSRLYASATQPGASTWTQVLPIPFASPTLANNISISVDATNITITTGSNRSAFTRCFVIIEWITEV